MKILLIRHGQSVADLLSVHEGRADYPLTDLGISQAEKLALFLSNHYSIEEIWSSPLSRARQTAEILSQQCLTKIHFHDDLMEWNNGPLAGMDRNEAKEKFPIPVDGWKPHESLKGTETEIEFCSRVHRVFSFILNHTSASTLAIVSHGGTISRMIQCFLQMPLINSYRFPTDDTGFHLLEIQGNFKKVCFLNNTSHLTP